MKFDKLKLGLLTCVAAIAVACAVALVAKTDTGLAKNGKEADVTYSLVVTGASVTEAGQIGQLDVAQLAIVKEYSAPVASSIASKDALANAPNTATVPVDQVAASATYVTDQLALKITASAAKYAFATTGESVQSGTS